MTIWPEKVGESVVLVTGPAEVGRVTLVVSTVPEKPEQAVRRDAVRTM
jgi:hypothetical protein